MCILIHHPVGTMLTDEHFADFYDKNPDGFGAIINVGHKVDVIKRVGTLNEIQRLYDKHIAGREAIIHMRWRTHGDIDLHNCHPYEVVPGLWMAHNGVLSHGNTADPAKSDTWHYINDVLRPLLTKDPELIHEEAFQKLVAAHIGYSNKFGFMDHEGRTVILNKQSGIEHDNVWYSNTYAWTPGKFGYRPVYNTYGNSAAYATSPTWKAWNKYDEDERAVSAGLITEADPVGKSVARKAKRKTRKAGGKRPTQGKLNLNATLGKLSTDGLSRIIRSLYNELSLDGYDGVLRWVQNHPMKAMHFIYEMFPQEGAKEISDMVNMDPANAAEVIMDGWEMAEFDLMDLAGIEYKDYNMEGVYE